MQIANNDLRSEIKEKGIFYWQIANKLNIYPGTLSVWLRHELPNEKKERIRSVIKDLSQK